MSNIDNIRGWRDHLLAAGRSAGTVEVRVSHIRRMIDELGEPALIDRAALVGWLASHDWAPSTRRSVRASICLFFGWLADTGMIDDNPARGLPRAGQVRGLPRPASEGAIMAAVRQAGQREQLMIELMALCGLRRGEVATVHSSNLYTSGGADMLRVAGKGGHMRYIPVPPHIASEIRKAQGWVFPGQIGGHLAAATVGKLVARHLPSGVTPHALRHRYATEVYSRSRDIRAVQALLGHARLDTTAAYVAVSGQATREAAQTGWRIAC